jgi:hypothetical protein
MRDKTVDQMNLKLIRRALKEVVTCLLCKIIVLTTLIDLKGYYYFSSSPNTKALSAQDPTNKLTLHTISSKILDAESQD